jgi:hypothetical protein
MFLDFLANFIYFIVKLIYIFLQLRLFLTALKVSRLTLLQLTAGTVLKITAIESLLFMQVNRIRNRTIRIRSKHIRTSHLLSHKVSSMLRQNVRTIINHVLEA